MSERATSPAAPTAADSSTPLPASFSFGFNQPPTSSTTGFTPPRPAPIAPPPAEGAPAAAPLPVFTFGSAALGGASASPSPMRPRARLPRTSSGGKKKGGRTRSNPGSPGAASGGGAAGGAGAAVSLPLFLSPAAQALKEGREQLAEGRCGSSAFPADRSKQKTNFVGDELERSTPHSAAQTLLLGLSAFPVPTEKERAELQEAAAEALLLGAPGGGLISPGGTQCGFSGFGFALARSVTRRWLPTRCDNQAAAAVRTAVRRRLALAGGLHPRLGAGAGGGGSPLLVPLGDGSQNAGECLALIFQQLSDRGHESRHYRGPATELDAVCAARDGDVRRVLYLLYADSEHGGHCRLLPAVTVADAEDEDDEDGDDDEAPAQPAQPEPDNTSPVSSLLSCLVEGYNLVDMALRSEAYEKQRPEQAVLLRVLADHLGDEAVFGWRCALIAADDVQELEIKQFNHLLLGNSAMFEVATLLLLPVLLSCCCPC